MKKILFICHTISHGGGAEKVLNTLIEELSSEYEIDVLEWLEDTQFPFYHNQKNVRHLNSIAYSDRKAASIGKNVKLNRFRHNILALTNIFLPNILYKYFVKDNYDYEISFNYLYTSALVANSHNRNSKKIMWIHSSIDDLNEPHSYSLMKYRLYRWMQRRAFIKANAIVAISKRTHTSIKEFDSLLSCRIYDIYNGYDFNAIENNSLKETIPSSDKYRLITMGRLSDIKNVRLQLQALDLLYKRGIEIELLVLGEGEQQKEIEEYALKNSNVKVIGFKNNPYPYLASSDALIITSYSEGFPTIAVEAISLGKPVISTPVAGTDELITDETGIIVDWNPESVAEGVVKLMNTKYDSNKLRNHVAKYSKEIWAQNVKNLFKQLDTDAE